MKQCLLLACLLAAGCVRPTTEGEEFRDTVATQAGKDPRAAERVRDLFAAMHRGTYKEMEFPVLGWEHVPALLERAPSRAMLKSFPVNPLSSMMQDRCPEGIVALWLIEGIRQGGRYPSLNPVCKGENSKDTQQRAVAAYLRWWQKVRSDPSAAAKRDPFAGTDLSWY